MRDDAISITKGIGIILMVAGHAGVPRILHDFIYLFHMPLFFFMSGYLIKPSAHLSRTGCNRFIVKKIKSIWWPYAMWGIIFVLLHNLFFDIGFYNDAYPKYDFQELLHVVIRTIFFYGNEEQLLGGYWFLPQLFWGTIIVVLILAATHKIKGNKYYSLAIVLSIALLLYFFGGNVPFTRIYWLTFYCSIFILGGYVFMQLDIKPFSSCSQVIVLVLLIGTSFLYSDSITKVSPYSFFPFLITGILGTWLVYSFSKGLNGKTYIARALVYIGDLSLVILTWHFFSFKVVSYLAIHVTDMDNELLSSFPVISDKNILVAIFYIIAGIGVPIIISIIGKYLRHQASQLRMMPVFRKHIEK